MKKYPPWIQLVISLIVVFSILAILRGILQIRRQAAEAANDPIICTVTLSPELVSEGEILYARNCAGCHGANLEGSPDWETPLGDGSNLPPPLNSSGHSWQHSDKALVYTITNGRNLSKTIFMPAFKDKLSEAEIKAIVEYMKSKWGAEELNHQDTLNYQQP